MTEMMRRAFILLEKKADKTKEFKHALRVADYAYQMACERKLEDPDFVYVCGLLHDLVEDCGATYEDISFVCPNTVVYYGHTLSRVIELVTKEKEESYDDYMTELLDSSCWIAKIVKAADMKDHLMQVDTLTDKLKEKYIPYIGRLMS